MNYVIKTSQLSHENIECFILGLFAQQPVTDTALQLDQRTRQAISQALHLGDFNGELGTTLLLPCLPNQQSRILLVGCGPRAQFTAEKFRTVVSKAMHCLKNSKVSKAVCDLANLPVVAKDLAWKIRQIVECSENAYYCFDQLKTKKANQQKTAPALRQLILSVPANTPNKPMQKALKTGIAIAEAMKYAKDLANLPANICTPAYLAQAAHTLAKTNPAVKLSVLDEKAMKKLGMGALLAVAQGSHQPAKLIVLHYKPSKKVQKTIALVGKGVTFDSGGISIKPAAAMDAMKYDMCGAAAVLATLQACAALKLPLEIVGVIPATENLPGGNAIKPGDIVTTLSGKTVEILNTDAEGRLILCDALTYCARFKPDIVIDIATLTGAVIIALGNLASGLLSNNDSLAQALLQAGHESCDKVWQLPLWEEYQEDLHSNFADIANISEKGMAGSIMGASFLAHFTQDYCWAHLDIAGTASQRNGAAKGATGRPVPLLIQYLLGLAGAGTDK